MKLEMRLQKHYNIKAEKSSIITSDLKFYHAKHGGTKPEVAEMANPFEAFAVCTAKETELQLNLKR